jgi:hypothetical protein
MPESASQTISFAHLGADPAAVASERRAWLLAIGGLIVVLLVFAPFDRLRWTLLSACALALLGWSVTYTTRHHKWLIFVLLLIEVLTSATCLPDEWNSATRYTLEAIFCLPILPAFYRSGLWRTGGFRLLPFYLGWAVITVIYSLAPVYSAGRLFNTSLLFACYLAVCSRGR